MTISYSWEVSTVKTIDEYSYQDVIVMVYWKKIGTDERGRTASFSGVTSFTAKDNTDFTPVENVTKKIMLKWVTDTITPDQDAKMNAAIEKLISRQPY